MIVTKGKIKSLSPCEDGYKYWLEQGIEDLASFMTKASDDYHADWALWLFVRCVPRQSCLKLAVFSAELVLDIFEKEYPEDSRPRLAIEAAKRVIEDDTDENRSLADAAADAAHAAHADASHAAAAYSDAATDAAVAAYAAAAAAANAANANAAAAYAAAHAAYAAFSAFSAFSAADTKKQNKIIDYAINLLEVN